MSKKVKISVVPFGGLGNRMRVLNSAFYLSKDIHAETTLVWLKKAELNADFFRIFEHTSFHFKLLRGFRYKVFLKFVKHIYINKYPKLYRFILGIFFDKILFDFDVQSLSFDTLIQQISSSKSVLIATCYEFYPFPGFDNFKLNKELEAKINSFQIPEGSIGVHIRRTDHVDIIKESSLENYHVEMRKYIAENQNVNFYLATDDAAVKAKFLDIYNSRIITQDAPLNRDSEAGIFGGIVDIYNLARCYKIICNVKSSFAVTAKLIGKEKELINV